MGGRRVQGAVIGRAALVLAVVAGLSACATPRVESVSTAGMPGELESIHAAALTKDQAVFWVTSNGCTEKKDLTPIVSIRGADAVITLRRLEQDRCDHPMRDGVQLKWTFEELGLPPGAPVSINNPYQLPQT